jgi:hypothetical protein
MRCMECDGICGKRALQLMEGSERCSFCSFECLIAYSVGRIRQRIQYNNHRVRILTRQKLQLARLNACAHARHRS